MTARDIDTMALIPESEIAAMLHLYEGAAEPLIVGRLSRESKIRRRTAVVLAICALLAGVAIGFIADSSAPTERQLTSRTVRVPDVTGIQLPEAFRILRAAGLRVTVRDEFSLAPGAAPVVRVQEPAAAVAATQGGAVKLRLASEDAVRPSRKRSILAPDLTGLSLGEGLRKLKAVGISDWTVPRAPPLEASSAPSLFDAYVITRLIVVPSADAKAGL
jgi:hypothetical protein